MIQVENIKVMLYVLTDYCQLINVLEIIHKKNFLIFHKQERTGNNLF